MDPPSVYVANRRSSSVWHRELRELSLERTPVNSQFFRGLGDVAAAVGQDPLDVLPLDPRQRGGLLRLASSRRCLRCGLGAAALERCDHLVDVGWLGQIMGGAETYRFERGGNAP